MTLKAYLQLVRFPNVFTAAADSLAGWLLVRGTLEEPGIWLPLVLASACTYAGGIALNDVLDIAIDRAERPTRPLPSGRVSIKVARRLAGGLIAAGLVLSAVPGIRNALLVEIGLILCVLLYDFGLKRSAFGPELMGTCRGLNLLLGLCGGEMMGGPWFWLAACCYGLFVTGITWISRSEVYANSRTNLFLGVMLQNLAIGGMILVAFWNAMNRWTNLGGIAVLLVIAGLVARKTIAAFQAPSPGLIQASIKTAILSLVGLHVGLLLAVQGPFAALAVGLLWLPAAFTGRWIYST